jgi:hypothetical protein
MSINYIQDLLRFFWKYDDSDPANIVSELVKHLHTIREAVNYIVVPKVYVDLEELKLPRGVDDGAGGHKVRVRSECKVRVCYCLAKALRCSVVRS